MRPRIREATMSDASGIANVVSAAFDGAFGQELVDLIRELMVDETAQPALSLVATMNRRIVGHILFTKVSINAAMSPRASCILAPLSVHPAHQNQGIGGRLIEAGLKLLGQMGVDLVFVLGHPGYYRRFGFSPAGVKGLEAPYPIPAENADAWMVRELRSGAMKGVTGQVQCANALDDPRHWQE